MKLIALLAGVGAASWLECPPSFGAGTDRRGGDQVGPCDGGRLDQTSPIVTEVRAGQRLKIAWPSNNLGGGLVRLALAPEAKSHLHSSFDMAVLKSACFGHDQRAGRYNSSTAECNHPCNARPGCHYQAASEDLERYDTSIGIPTNLPDGSYVLQWKALIGNDPLPYYSCAKLRITGGSTDQVCVPPAPRPLECRVADGGPKQTALTKGCLYGSFCFMGGHRGAYSNDVDASIGHVDPINRECDGRGGCEGAVNRKKCDKELLPITPCPVSKAGFTTNLRDSLELTSRRFRSAPARLRNRHRVVKSFSSTDVIMRLPVGGHLRPERRDDFRPRYILPSSSIGAASSYQEEDAHVTRRRVGRGRRSHWARLGRTGNSRRARHRRRSHSSSRVRCGSRCFRRRHVRPEEARSRRRLGRARVSDSDESDVLRRFRVRIRRGRRHRRSSTSSEDGTESWTSSTDTSVDYNAPASRDVLAIFGRNGRVIRSMPAETTTVTTTEATVLVGSVTVTAASPVTVTHTHTLNGTTVTQVDIIAGGQGFVTVTATETATMTQGDLVEPRWEPTEAPIEEFNPELPPINEDELMDFDWAI